MDYFRDKIAIITGGASGIGAAVARELGKRGAIVIVTDINVEGARNVAQEIVSGGGRAAGYVLDVTREREVKRLIDEAVKKNGRIDFMFNNAGIPIVGEVFDMTLDHWRDIIDVNLMGVMYGTIHAYAIMVKQGFGHIVNTASLAGLVPVPTEVAYTMTKYAVVGLTTSLRAEGREYGVRASVVCPGFVKTNIYNAGHFLGVSDREPFFKKIPFMLGAGKAARVILGGVKKNKEIITVTKHAWLLWIHYRIHPALLFFFHRMLTRTLRSHKKPQA